MYCWIFPSFTIYKCYCYINILLSICPLLSRWLLLHISSHVICYSATFSTMYCSFYSCSSPLCLTFNPLHFIFDHLLLCFNPTHLLPQLPTFVFTHFLCWFLTGCYFIFKAAFIVLQVLLITFAYNHSLFVNLCLLFSFILFSLHHNYDWDGFSVGCRIEFGGGNAAE